MSAQQGLWSRSSCTGCSCLSSSPDSVCYETGWTSRRRKRKIANNKGGTSRVVCRRRSFWSRSIRKSDWRRTSGRRNYWKSKAWRGGRVAEGNGLLNRHRAKVLSRVQIPPSPPNLACAYRLFRSTRGRIFNATSSLARARMKRSP